jgi:hypothetical protein
VTSDHGDGRGGRLGAAVPTPSCMRARRMPVTKAVPADRAVPGTSAGAVLPAMPAMPAMRLAAAGSGRSTVREALDAALAGVPLGGRDRNFLSRLVHFDKRNAASTVSLLRRARQAGRDEAALTPRQLEIVLAALGDAARYRSSGLAATGCWDCDNVPSGRCAEHARDNDRAQAYAELAAALSEPGPDGLREARKIADYPRPVAS